MRTDCGVWLANIRGVQVRKRHRGCVCANEKMVIEYVALTRFVFDRFVLALPLPNVRCGTPEKLDDAVLSL